MWKRDFIRSSSVHKEARQKLDYWEIEVPCHVTVTVCVCVWGGVWSDGAADGGGAGSEGGVTVTPG